MRLAGEGGLEWASRKIDVSAKGVVHAYRVNMSEIISTSVSAAAIFCSEDILGWPPKRKDIVMVDGGLVGRVWSWGSLIWMTFQGRQIDVGYEANTYMVVWLVGS